MFNLETYVTPILLSYLDKYVQNFKAGDAQVSLWGGGVTLHNLVLKPGVLQQEVLLPFTLISGRIHELLIQVPWTKIMSEPIVVTINTIECILSIDAPPPDENAIPERGRSHVVEAPPGYMQALVRRIVSNISVRINSLIVKYVHDDIVLSLTVKRLSVDSVGANWEPLFADIDPEEPLIRRLVCLDDLTLCLDKCDSDGKIRIYQEPLLYRCQLDLRVLTRLVSAKSRRASSFCVQLRSSFMSWGVTNEQLELLLRLWRDNPLTKQKSPSPIPKQSLQLSPLHSLTSNSAEPVRSASWSQWAWSWLPSWTDRESREEPLAPPAPIPVEFVIYLEQVALDFKILEMELGRQRSRNILSLSAKDAVIKGSICSPTMLRVKFGARDLSVSSRGRCVCGHDNTFTLKDEPTIYLERTVTQSDWKWTDENFEAQRIEIGVAADEQMPESPTCDTSEGNYINVENQEQIPGVSVEGDTEKDKFWSKMSPVIYIEMNHDRAPSDQLVNPFENPPKDFEYSDWIEECVIKVNTQPMTLKLNTNLLHRLKFIKNIYDSVLVHQISEPSMRTLTVEECEALSENLPQRRIGFEINDLRIQLLPWDHSVKENPVKVPIMLALDIPKAVFNISAPLYPHRVCSAACQVPDKSEPLWQEARLHISGNITLQTAVCSKTDTQPFPCLDANINFVTHRLLHMDFFTSRKILDFNYTLKIREVKICGSSARLHAAFLVPMSLLTEQPCEILKYTTLATDALHDEDAVAIDVALEDLIVWGYRKKLIQTHILTLNSVKATAHHAPRDEEPKQVWLFSGPDTDTTTPYIRTRFQLCKEPTQDSIDYFGIWLEPSAICVDPLFGAWLAYRPKIKVTEQLSTISLGRVMPSSQYLSRRRLATPSSSGRGGSRSGSGTEQVHSKTRSHHSTQSGSESEKKQVKPPNTPKITEPRWPEETLLKIHERIKRLLIAVEIGLINVYVTTSSANATGCVTVRDAIERHAMASQKVLIISLGHLSIISPSTKHLWEQVKINEPTFLTAVENKGFIIEDAFPWRIRLADVSCYTLEVRAGLERSGREKAAKGFKSQLKATHIVMSRSVLDIVTTSITLSVVAKSMKIILPPKKPEAKKLRGSCSHDDMTKYFRSGIDFKPSSLKEFVRGPSRGKTINPQPKENEAEHEEATVKNGPIMSLGVNIHADTPPINIRLDHDQISVIAESIHCCIHVLKLLQTLPLTLPKQNKSSSSRSLLRSTTSELDAQSVSIDAESIHPSEELIPIFEAFPEREPEKLKTFLWFQWVVSNATLVVTTPWFRLAFDADDVISSLDMQDRYDQLKIKVASASIKHYERLNDDWVPGVLGGRVLEAREPTNATEESDFLSVTVTSVLISQLPASLNEELTLKTFKKIEPNDHIWEIYVALAPLEAVLRPNILEPIVSAIRLFPPKTSCPLQYQENSPEEERRSLIYVNAGGLRLLLADQIESTTGADDTIMFVVGKTTVNPYPQNPMCRNLVNPAPDNELISSLVIEGRQYEILIKGLTLRSVQFRQLANHEVVQSDLKTSGENPALKWSQQVDSPIVTPILHSMDINLVMAPPVYVMGALICGPAIEINLVTECSLELNLNRIDMMIATFQRFTETMKHRDSVSNTQIQDTVCPYANFSIVEMNPDSSHSDSDSIIVEELKSAMDILLPVSRTDSGIVTSQSIQNTSAQKKSVEFVDYSSKSSEFLELWVAFWTIDVSIYINDDDSPEVIALRPPVTYHPPSKEPQQSNEPTSQKVVIEEHDEPESSMGASKSLTDTVRHADIAKQNIDLVCNIPLARKTEGNIPLCHFKLTLPNLYYFRQKHQKKIQASLFDLWVGLGAAETDDQWSSPLITTGPGVLDPETGIEPALIRLEGVLKSRGQSSSEKECGPVKLELERPLQFEVSTDKLKRLKALIKLIQKNIPHSESPIQPSPKPHLDKCRRLLIHNNVDVVTVKTCSIDIKSEIGAISFRISSLQLGAGKKPDRLSCKMLFCLQKVTVGPSTEVSHLLQPMLIGVHFSATWDAWRRNERTLSAREPTIRLGIDLDQVIFDIRPEDLDVVLKLKEALRKLTDEEPEYSDSKRTLTPTNSLPTIIQSSSCITKLVVSTAIVSESVENFYSDDFRSGAFKIVKEGPVPMAYQILIKEDRVMWRYPHPRAITKLTISPIPDQDTDTECVLELYSTLLCRWERRECFKIPILEEMKYQLHCKPSEAVFACLWRVKVCSHNTSNPTNYKFDVSKFLPGRDPTAYDPPGEMNSFGNKTVTGQHLFGVLRMDSTFAPRLLPRLKLAVKLSCLEINVHNTMPQIDREARNLEGYYVSRPLCRSHRVANIRLTDTAAYLLVASTPKIVFDAEFSSDIINSATGTLEPLFEEFRTQGVLYLEEMPRLNVRVGKISIAMNVPRVYTIRALIDDWKNAYNQRFNSDIDIHTQQPAGPVEALDGRVTLWVHNECSVALRVGQEGTQEVVPVGAGVSLAYRWRSPVAPKKLRFAFAGPCTDWHWSNSIQFKEGSCKVLLENPSEVNGNEQKEKDHNENGSTPVTLYVRVASTGARRDMYLSGRVRLVNILRQPLMYMIRYRKTTVDPWHTISAGVLNPESIGLSVLCGPGLTSLKMKLTSEESGWSGDIPVQECRRRNLQWLVKIPNQGEVPFIAVWCRVVRAQSDGRFVATFWPLYVLTSELPLDMNMTITSELRHDPEPKPQYVRIQTAPGRGACTHISTYGKSTDKNFISLQYRDFEYRVTKDELELRYEHSSSPVFEEHPTIQTVDEHLLAITQWLNKSGRDAESSWPHTLVRHHWPGAWRPALLQPKTAINVCYVPVRVGGGCSLELRLLPQVLFANASTIALTLRSYDGAPVCKIEPGVAIAASNTIVNKPFYMSIEMGRETFVSTNFEVHCKIPGRYEEPLPKHIWIDRPTRSAIHCNQKVALLSVTLEMEESMYVFGITSTFAIRNLLKMDVYVASIAVPKETENFVLRPKNYKVIHPAPDDRLQCIPLTQFSLQERWLGDHVDELNTFLCLSLDEGSGSVGAPILLGKDPFRRPIALRCGQQVLPVVICQQQHAGRWVITIAEDPCPQFFICNRTAKSLAIAEPEISKEFQLLMDFPPPVGIQECIGTRWWCIVEAKSSTYYSCPHYYNTYPPKIFTKRLQPLLVGILREEMDPDWSEPFAVINGETLIQLNNGVMIKVNIKCNPHTTLIELLDVDQFDLSASEIRRQLLNVEKPQEHEVEKDTSMTSYQQQKQTEARNSKTNLKLLPEQLSTVNTFEDSSLVDLSQAVKDDIEASLEARNAERLCLDRAAYNSTTRKTELWSKKSNEVDRIRALVDSITVTFAKASDDLPILALTLQRLSVWARENSSKQKATLTVANIHIDNTQYESGEYDFAVVVTTEATLEEEIWPPLWNMNDSMFDLTEETARLLLIARRDMWTTGGNTYIQLTKVEARAGPLGLYIEDAFVTALVELARVVVPPVPYCSDTEGLAEANSLTRPLLIQRLYIHPLQLTLTLHTAVRMYIALDQSPLNLSEFELQYVMTTQENLIRALTVHYLSAAILGAGWVVGGLELLGSPAAVAARVAEASGGLRGIASAASAALLRSLSACARSVARNLDILAGDEEHTRRAAAARRRQPPSLMAGIVDGVTNFAVTLLGAVGGLAHHPLLSVVVGETDSRVVGLRRGLVGAIAKPLSATADLVASAGHGILNQTGWDPVPQPLFSKIKIKEPKTSWRQNCVRWMFRLPEMNVLAGFDIQLGDSQWQLLLTDKYLVIFDVEADLVVESINLKHCSIGSWKGEDSISIRVLKKSSKATPSRILDSQNDLTTEMNPTAFARVARYTGATEDEPGGAYREITFTPHSRLACSLHAALFVAIQQNTL